MLMRFFLRFDFIPRVSGCGEAGESWDSLTECCLSLLHNSDLRDFHEYILKQVWGAQIYTRRSNRRFDLVET